MTDIEERLARLEAAVFPESKERKLVSLSDWNRARSEAHERANRKKPRRNGIACPNCGEELVDSDPHSMMMSSPPQMAIKCTACDYTGRRTA